MKLRRRTLSILSTILAITTLDATAVRASVGAGDSSRTISLSTSGVTVVVSIHVYSNESYFDEGISNCYANTGVKLSSYSTTSLALRTSDVAEAIREAADELGANECRITVRYRNDTSEEIEDHELCKVETFRFDKDSYWSTSPETNCWEPE